jgi:hypothetical protein
VDNSVGAKRDRQAACIRRRARASVHRVRQADSGSDEPGIRHERAHDRGACGGAAQEGVSTGLVLLDFIDPGLPRCAPLRSRGPTEKAEDIGSRGLSDDDGGHLAGFQYRRRLCRMRARRSEQQQKSAADDARGRAPLRRPVRAPQDPQPLLSNTITFDTNTLTSRVCVSPFLVASFPKSSRA